MKKNALMLLFFIFPIYFLSAAELSLQNAVDLSLKNNPEINASKSVWDAAKAKIPAVLSLDDPKFELEYEQIPSGSRNLEDGMKMYKLEQMVMFPGKIFAEWQIAKANADISWADYQTKKWEITSQVKSAYFDLFYTDRAIKVISEVTELITKMKDIAQAEYIVGDVSQADIIRANVESLLMKNELLNVKNERKAKESRLKAILGESSQKTIETQAILPFPKKIILESDLQKLTAENRYELQKMKAEIAMKDAEHLLSKMNYFPDTMFAVKKRVGDGWDAMVSITIPLYFWKQGYGMAAVGLDRESAEANYLNMLNMTSWEVSEAYLRIESEKRTAKLFEESIVPQNYQALKVALAAYPAGKINFQTLLQIEQAYEVSRLKMYESQANHGKALAELERIIGKEIM